MNKYLLFLIFFSTLVFSQTIHIKYKHVRSSIAILYEDLYVNNSKALSIQDSILLNDPKNSLVGSVSANFGGPSGKVLPRKSYIQSWISNSHLRKFNSDEIVNEINFTVEDIVPEIKWTIFEKVTKTIAGYKCIMAKGIYRGTPIVAYFTKEISFSIGPYKFFGLPGAILDVREVSKSYNIWVAESIHLNSNFDTSYSFPSKFKTLNMKDYINLYDQSRIDFIKKVNDNLPSGVNSRTLNSNRFILEKQMEWEDSLYEIK